jgi:hypothetical protein
LLTRVVDDTDLAHPDAVVHAHAVIAARGAIESDRASSRTVAVLRCR